MAFRLLYLIFCRCWDGWCGSVALRPTQGMLKTQPRLGSDGHGQLVERNRHTPIRRLLNGQLVVSAPNVLDERMPGDDDSGATVLL
jgi:hypothetical protein